MGCGGAAMDGRRGMEAGRLAGHGSVRPPAEQRVRIYVGNLASAAGACNIAYQTSGGCVPSLAAAAGACQARVATSGHLGQPCMRGHLAERPARVPRVGRSY